MDEAKSIFFGDASRVVDSNITYLVNSANFGEEAWFEVILKGLLVDQGGQSVVVRELEVRVIGVKPVDSLLSGYRSNWREGQSKLSFPHEKRVQIVGGSRYGESQN